MSLRSEIFNQVSVIDRLLQHRMGVVQDIAAEIGKRDIKFIFLAARGTSDNAGLYAKYLWGGFNQLPIALAAPSLFSMYEKPPALKNALVLGISQSGQSPDIVSVVAEGRRQGVSTMAITNDPGSPLAQEAEFVIDLCATSSPSQVVVARIPRQNTLADALAWIEKRLDTMEKNSAKRREMDEKGLQQYRMSLGKDERKVFSSSKHGWVIDPNPPSRPAE